MKIRSWKEGKEADGMWHVRAVLEDGRPIHGWCGGWRPGKREKVRKLVRNLADRA